MWMVKLVEVVEERRLKGFKEFVGKALRKMGSENPIDGADGRGMLDILGTVQKMWPLHLPQKVEASWVLEDPIACEGFTTLSERYSWIGASSGGTGERWAAGCSRR